jgi:hypothetical protein
MTALRLRTDRERRFVRAAAQRPGFTTLSLSLHWKRMMLLSLRPSPKVERFVFSRIPRVFVASLLLSTQIFIGVVCAKAMQDAAPEGAQASGWRAHAVLAETYLRRGSNQAAIKEAELALQLGQEQAAAVRPILARALANYGDRDRAIAILQTHVKEYSSDLAASLLLESLVSSVPNVSGPSVPVAANPHPPIIPLPANPGWLPPDVDERIPPVVSGASCDVEEVVRKTGTRIKEFVTNVDRFTATETLEYQKISKEGAPSHPETRKFDYVVSIGEVRPGLLSVEEYRHARSSDEDPLQAMTGHGLPGIVLIFHPYEAVNFDIVCEGQAQLKETPVWQVHFRQRSDKPNRIRAYRVNGTPYLVSVKGRAWISADSYQVLKIETTLISPIPEIRLAADHTIIEYGPVHFQKDGTDMWLPQSADVYSEFKTRRRHERHSFSNYLLFSVGDQQQISAPKAGNASSSNPGP